MSRLGFLAGVLLMAAGLLMLLLIAMGIGLMPDGADASLLGVDIRSFMTVVTGLCLASGITLVGLNVGHWTAPETSGRKARRGGDNRNQLEDEMNNDVLKGKWMQMKGEVRRQWGKLTDDDVAQIEGSSEKLIGKLQERYGYARDQAQRQYDAWVKQADQVTPTR